MAEFNVSIARLYMVRLAMLWLCLQAEAFAQTAADQEKYLRLANEAHQELASGKLRDVDALIKKQEQLVAIGVAFCRKYAGIYPEHERFLQLVADSAKDMAQMTQDEITRNWYRGELPKQLGIAVDHKDHFEEVINLMDLVVHPSYVIIALKQYKKKPDSALLKRSKYEMGELIAHAEILFNKRAAH